MLFLKDIFLNSKGKDWYDGILWSAWQLICGLMPIWITLILLRVFKQPLNIEVFTNNAEFALYSASFLGTCLYIVLRDFRRKNFPSVGFLCLILVPALLCSGFIFSLTAINSIVVFDPLYNLDKAFLIQISIYLMPTVFLVTFLLIVVDNVRSSIDLYAQKEIDYNKLDTDFDSLGD